jgi:hypothetical protein
VTTITEEIRGELGFQIWSSRVSSLQVWAHLIGMAASFDGGWFREKYLAVCFPLSLSAYTEKPAPNE